MDELKVVVGMLDKKEKSPHQRPVLRGFDYLVKPDMLEKKSKKNLELLIILESSLLLTRTTTPNMPRNVNVLNVVVDTLKDTSAPPRPVQHLPKEHCLSPTRGALPARNHAPTMMSGSGSCGPFPTTTPVVPRRTDGLNVVVDLLKQMSAYPRPVQHLPKEICLSPTALPAGNHAPTLSIRPGAGGQRPTTAANVGQGSQVGVDVPSIGVSTGVAWRGKGTTKIIKTRLVSLVSPLPLFFYYYYPPEAGPICPATTRPPREWGKERDSEQTVGGVTQRCRSGGGNKYHRRKTGGGFGSVKQRGGGLCAHNLLVGLLLMVVCGFGGVEGFAKLPNGDESYHQNSNTGNAGTLRRVVSDWIAGGASKSTVVATYGPIEDWDVSEVTNMRFVFYNLGSFNADLSEWNTGAVTTMQQSKCTLCVCVRGHVATLSAVGAVLWCCGVFILMYTTIRQLDSSNHNSHTFCYFVFVV